MFAAAGAAGAVTVLFPAVRDAVLFEHAVHNLGDEGAIENCWYRSFLCRVSRCAGTQRYRS